MDSGQEIFCQSEISWLVQQAFRGRRAWWCMPIALITIRSSKTPFPPSIMISEERNRINLNENQSFIVSIQKKKGGAIEVDETRRSENLTKTWNKGSEKQGRAIDIPISTQTTKWTDLRVPDEKASNAALDRNHQQRERITVRQQSGRRSQWEAAPSRGGSELAAELGDKSWRAR